jgi:hypothetical protein
MSKADIETRKWLNKISTIRVGDCVDFTYQGKAMTGIVDAEIIQKTQYRIVHPAGGRYSVWREYIHRKIKRVVWSGLSESLFQLACDEGSSIALEQCESLILSLETVVECGNQNQQGHAAQLLRAVHYAVEQIRKHVDG